MNQTSPDKTPDSYKGKLLLATPNMGDPRFTRSVIYICAHDENGAMGIIINKSKDNLKTSSLLKHIGIDGQLCIADSPVLSGGPVDIDRGFVLHSDDYFTDDSSLKLSGTLVLTSTKDILNALVTCDAPQRAMLAVGYAGWDGGQLETELAQNAWLIAPADEELIFSHDLDGKWSQALRAMGIDPAALAASGGRA
ncbi:MAG: YqgE/AlgH family protein [Litorimonas sp.]